jgi:hypothetical protein
MHWMDQVPTIMNHFVLLKNCNFSINSGHESQKWARQTNGPTDTPSVVRLGLGQTQRLPPPLSMELVFIIYLVNYLVFCLLIYLCRRFLSRKLHNYVQQLRAVKRNGAQTLQEPMAALEWESEPDDPLVTAKRTPNELQHCTLATQLLTFQCFPRSILSFFRLQNAKLQWRIIGICYLVMLIVKQRSFFWFWVVFPWTMVGIKPCVPRPLDVKGKGMREVLGVTEKGDYTVQTANISQRQYFVAHRLSCYIGNVFGLCITCVCFLLLA